MLLKKLSFRKVLNMIGFKKCRHKYKTRIPDDDDDDGGDNHDNSHTVTPSSTGSSVPRLMANDESIDSPYRPYPLMPTGLLTWERNAIRNYSNYRHDYNIPKNPVIFERFAKYER